jgi:hypothetical protein
LAQAKTRERSPGIDAYPERVARYPFVRWGKLKPAIVWKQGQHALTVGGTGSGKTTVMGEMLPRRSLAAVDVSKGADKTLTGPYFKDYETIRRWPPPSGKERVMLWPANGKTIAETRKNKQTVFQKQFDDVLLHRGHWCIAIDETHYMAESLGLERELTDMLEQGRSFDISMWNNTQRPAGIPLSVYVNSLHGFFFLTQEEYDVRRLGRMINRHTNIKEMMANIQRLDEHEFVYLDKTGGIPPVRSIVERGT